MKKGYDFDFATSTLTITDTFAKKASTVGSPEYRLIVTLRHDYPNLVIKKEEKKGSGKSGLNYSQMKDFISFHRNAEELRKQFDRVCALSRIHPMPYRYVKEWFENTFPYYSDKPNFDAEGFLVVPETLKIVEENKTEVPEEASTEEAAA